MPSSFPTQDPLVGLGMASLVVGTIGLLVFFMPILGIPLSAIALLLGILGFFGALPGWHVLSLRWSLAGVAMSALALGINVAVSYAPEGYLPDRKSEELWQPAPDRPYIPPPAPPG
jgi:hypothetical protein